MKNPFKRLGVLAVAGAFIGAGLVAGVVVPASADTSVQASVCVPQDAYTTTVNHPAVGEKTITVKNPEYKPEVPAVPDQPAVGEPTITVPNEDYVPGKPEIPAVPAVGEPTIVVENEDYEPAVEEVSHIVNHPAVTKVVHHDAETKVVHHEAQVKEHAAVTHTEYHFAKFTRERTKSKNGGWSEYGAWEKYSPETHTSWQLNTNPIGLPQFHSSGERGNGQYKVQWERQWQALYDGQTRVVVDKAAWTEVIKPAYDETVVVKEAYDETVVVTPAWDEKIIDVPAKPAVGEPTKTVSNPDYKPGTPAVPAVPAIGEPTKTVSNPDYKPAVTGTPAVPAVGEPTLQVENENYKEAWVETVKHDAVVCPVVTPKPEPSKASVKAAVEDEDTLAQTGGEFGIGLLVLGGIMILGGATIVVARRIKANN